MPIIGFAPLGAVPYTPRPVVEDPHAHDKHFDPGHGTPPPKLDTGVDAPPPKHHGPMCGHGPRPAYM